MTKFIDNIISVFYKIKSGLEKNKYIQALKQTFTVLFPVLFIGSMSLLLQSFPLDIVRNFIQTAFNGAIYKVLVLIYYVTFGLSSLYLTIAFTSKYYALISKRKDITVFACINSLICYFILIGPKTLIYNKHELLNYTGMNNIFVAVTTGIFATLLYHRFLNVFQKLTRNKFASAFQIGVNSIVPMILCILIFLGFSGLIHISTNGMNFHQLIHLVLSKPFEKIGATYIGGLLINLFTSIFSFFGIHGNSVFEDVYRNVFVSLNGTFINKHFFDLYTFIGGCGSTVGLLIALLFFSNSKRKKKIAALSSPLLTFNINETLIYGIPIMFNPIYFIPFILVPIVNYTIAYIAVSSGIVPPVVDATVQWTTPVFINGYFATNSILGYALQLLCVAVSTLIYVPFVLIDNKVVDMSVDEKNKELKILTIAAVNNYEVPRLANRSDYLGAHAEEIVLALEEVIYKNRVNLHYQPCIKDNKIYSVEALLRFSYHTQTPLYAPMVIYIAKEKDLFEPLTKVIIKQAIKDFKKMLRENKDLKLSVNIALDLLCNENFVNWLVNSVKEERIKPKQFGVEITENSKFFNKGVSNYFEILHNNGINIYMDDFSMGHTSIIYLQDHLFDYVKMDGSLVVNLDNPRSKEIINSIIKLGETLNFDVIAEFVETTDQVEKLKKMGFTIYQGHLYYQALPLSELIKELKEKH